MSRRQPCSPFRRRQYIAGDPQPTDACKCLAPTRPGSSYCARHHTLCHAPAGAEDARAPTRAGKVAA